MEKNWIEEIKEFIRKAMNKGLKIRNYRYTENDDNTIYYEINIFCNNLAIRITINKEEICIETPNGYANFNINLTKRDLLEIDAMMLSIEEYNEDMALTEFNNFFGEEENKVVNINNLDNDDE